MERMLIYYCRLLSMSLCVVLAFAVSACGGEPEPTDTPLQQEYELRVTPERIDAPAEGVAEGVVVEISTTAPSWRITASEGGSWVYVDKTSGLRGESWVRVGVAKNSGAEREMTLRVTATGCDDRCVVVHQDEYMDEPPTDDSEFYGGEVYIEECSDGMDSMSVGELTHDMGLAWNLGNTLECPGNEYAWGNIHTTRELIDAVAAMGFKSVRLPVAWGQYYDGKYGDYHISDEWLDRVQEIVDWCLANDMYVIINEHWDNGKLNELRATQREELNREFEVMWRRIAIRFRDYDYRLIFAGCNEVHDPELTTDGGDGYTDEAFESHNMLLRTFVQTVRSTGGRNAYRYLAVQSFNTMIDLLHRLELPEDNVEGRMLVECHYYTPYPFCLMERYESWLSDKDYMYLWDSYLPSNLRGNSYYTREQMERDIRKFGEWCCERGVGGIVGEFAAMSRVAMSREAGRYDEWCASRAWWHYSVVELCRRNGLCPMLWDNGDAKSADVDGGGWINRSRREFVYKSVLDAMQDAMRGEPFEYVGDGE